MTNIAHIIAEFKDNSANGDFISAITQLGNPDQAVTGNEFKEWKENKGEEFTWDKVAQLVGLTERRCHGLASFGEEPIPARVAKIVLLTEILHTTIL